MALASSCALLSGIRGNAPIVRVCFWLDSSEPPLPTASVTYQSPSPARRRTARLRWFPNPIHLASHLPTSTPVNSAAAAHSSHPIPHSYRVCNLRAARNLADVLAPASLRYA